MPLTLDQLELQLNNAVISNNLKLTSLLVDSPNVVTFLDSLAGAELDILNVSIVRNVDNVTVDGDVNVVWTIAGYTNKSVTPNHVTFTFTEDTPGAFLTATLDIVATAAYTTHAPGLSGHLAEDNFLEFTLDDLSHMDNSIADMSTFLTESGLDDYLPAAVAVGQLFDILKLESFDIKFSFDADADSTISMSCSISAGTPWEVITGLISLTDLSVTIASEAMTEAGESSLFYYGLISATFNLGQDFVVQIPIAGGTYWDVYVIPADGDVLPLIEEIGNFFGGLISVPTLGDTIKNDLTAIGIDHLNVTELGFAFNIESGEILYLKAVGLIDMTINGSPVDIEIDVVTQLGETGGWTFSGFAQNLPPINISALVGSLGDNFGGIDSSTKSVVDELQITDLAVVVDTASHSFTLGCRAMLDVNSQEVPISVDIAVTESGGSYQKSFAGSISLEEQEFLLAFSDQDQHDYFIAVADDSRGVVVPIQQLVDFDFGVAIVLNSAAFAFLKGAPANKHLVSLDIGLSFNLSNLPLIGSDLAGDKSIDIKDLQILIATTDFAQADIGSFNSLLPATNFALPDRDIKKGLSLNASIDFGDSPETLSLPVAGGDPPAGGGDPPEGGTLATQDTAKWFKVQKKFGPVHFERVGVQYTDHELWFLLDAAIQAAGLTLTLDGLALGSPIDRFEPKFNLKGIGIDYSAGDTEIGGYFLREHVVAADGEEYDEYDGAAVLKTATFALSGIGSYARIEGEMSLFVYAVLDFPLGGPDWFFVTGLAAGFGYNRALSMPTIDKVATFPLVEQAINNSGDPSNLQQAIDSIKDYIKPSLGEDFLAVGLKWTSYKLIDSFAVLTISFGHHLEIDLLGLSTMVVPPQVSAAETPLAEVQMAFKITIDPDSGFVGLNAQLISASYLLSRACHLTGGFAFWTWFKGEHKGDFVQTLGGYHPDFDIPEHYPRVPRLGFNWQVDSHISIKGNAYYALTARALMAGGHLDATWKSGALEAWFKAGADFLISWKPYHYDAHISVDMGVRYTFHFFGTHHISVHIGADVHVWGPEFAGTAHIHYWVVSLTVSFGAKGKKIPPPIPWSEFRQSFLPADDNDVCGLKVVSGLLDTVQDSGNDYWVVNAKDLRLSSTSLIPLSEAYSDLAGASPISLAGAATSLGIAPMQVGLGDVTSSQHISIEKIEGGNPVDAGSDFAFTPELKKAPTALWSGSMSPKVNDERFIDDTVGGINISPAQPPQAGATHSIWRKALRFEPLLQHHAFVWPAAPPFDADASLLGPTTWQDCIDTSINDSAVAAERNSLVQALGLSPVIDLTGYTVKDLLDVPQIDKKYETTCQA